MTERPTLLIIGPTPPPYHGVSVATQTILASPLADRFRLVHLDIADRRGIGHVDKPDLHDVFLFTKQFFRNLALIVREKPALFYIPISQTRIGFLRDSLFIIPALIARIPVIIHLRGANFDVFYAKERYLWKVYMGMILGRVSRFIVLGEMLRPIFSRWATPEQISVVANGIQRPSTRELSTSVSPRSDGGVFRVVFLSNLSRQKGLFSLLEAVPLVANACPKVEFLIAGPWVGEATRQEAEQRVTASGVADKVRFVGPVTGEQKSVFLRSGDLFVFPGVQQEGQPWTVLEAMREGLPVVATDRGCLRETVLDGITGFIIPPNSPKAIAEKIIYLICHPELRHEMAANSRKRFESHYTLENFIGGLEEVFRQTIMTTRQQNAQRALRYMP